MKNIPPGDHRNLVLLGHTGSGKTTLLDAILFKLGVSERLGATGDGTSFADYSDEERDRKISIWAKPFSALYKTHAAKPVGLTFIDTPGYADFTGQMIAATAVADAALLVIDAAAGIQVGTAAAWRRCEALQLPRGIVITGLDKENVSFAETLLQIQDAWGKRCVPVELPTHDRRAIIDMLEDQIPDELKVEAERAKNLLEEDAAEEDDALLEKYLGGEHLTPDELTAGLRVAIKRQHLVPVFEAEPLQGVGIEQLLEEIARLFPSPADRGWKDAQGQALAIDPAAPLVAQVWRTVNDAFVGQLSFVRILGGTLKADSEIYNTTRNQKERIGLLQRVNGRKTESVPEAHAGDIVALAKLKITGTNDTLCAIGHAVALSPILFPNPVMALAVAPRTPGDDDKIGTGLHRLAEEDPTIRVERNAETKEMIIAGMGDIHLDLAVARMKKRSHVDVTLSVPRIPYKETVTATGEGHYKHKKQSGGRGQYGEVYLRVEPLPEGDAEWFVDGIVGTSIPRNFLPAIEKGLLEGMNRGALAGFPVVRTRVTVYDGSHHEVDSSEVSFKIAAGRAFTDGALKARPVLLEPILHVKICVPEQYLGDITGDLNHRRGRIHAIAGADGLQVIEAEVPQSEMQRYATELRSITHGQGYFEAAFSRYDVVPSNLAQKLISEAQKRMHPEEE